MFGQETHVATRVHLSQLSSNHLLVRMLVAPVRVYSFSMNKHVDTYAGLDTAADHNICSSELSSMLGLTGDPIVTTLETADGQ